MNVDAIVAFTNFSLFCCVSDVPVFLSASSDALSRSKVIFHVMVDNVGII